MKTVAKDKKEKYLAKARNDKHAIRTTLLHPDSLEYHLRQAGVPKKELAPLLRRHRVYIWDN